MSNQNRDRERAKRKPETRYTAFAIGCLSQPQKRNLESSTTAPHKKHVRSLAMYAAGIFVGDGPFDITDFDITESDITNLI